jgi:predicted transcriptional regulator
MVMTNTGSQSIGVSKKRWVVCFENTILDLDLSIYEKMVYIVLCSHAKKDGPAFPSVKTIAREASCSRTKVFEALNKLEEMGVISRSPRISGGRGQTSSLYEINDIEPRPRSGQGSGSDSPSPSAAQTEASVTRTGGVRLADGHIRVFEQDYLNKTKEQLTPPTPPEPPGGRDGEGDFGNLKQKTHDTEKKERSPGEKTASFPSFPLEPEVYDVIREIYNTVLPELAQAEKITFSRARVLKHRLMEDPARRNPDWWDGYFKRVRNCPWLMGKNTSCWRTNFDWLVGEKGMQKILEGVFQESSGLSLQEKYMTKEGILDAKALLQDPAFLAYR